MHIWDGGSDDIEIGYAAVYIGRGLKKWGRVSVSDMKEKFGTARVYCRFGWDQVHCITHPGYHFSQYPKWLWTLDCLYFSFVVGYLNYIVVPYQKWLYTYMYGRALRKWPYLRLEILSGADYPELLGKYGVHCVRRSESYYQIYYDWHPDNGITTTRLDVSEPPLGPWDCASYHHHPAVQEEWEGPFRWIKRDVEQQRQEGQGNNGNS